MSYARDREWSDRYIPAISTIVGPRLLVPAPFEVDAKQATDLIVLRARDMTIAARVRRHGFADRYPYEFTIRSRRDNGTKTELSKIVDGWADWMFYGHAAREGDGFDRWFLVDLHALRAAFIRDGMKAESEIKWEEKSNGDGTHFVALDLRSFRPSILVASSHEIDQARVAA
jgi:hypothetical protein